MVSSVILSVGGSFEAARRVSKYSTSHQSSNLHGHSFVANIRHINRGAEEEFDLTKLEEELCRVIKELDYSYLNDRIANPDDEGLAMWLQDKLGRAGNLSVAVQSTASQGVELSSNQKGMSWRLYDFHAAHRLPNVPMNHKCGRMHGHSFAVSIHVHSTGMRNYQQPIYDFLDAMWKPLGGNLNFNCLNNIRGLENPTSEMIAKWIFEKLAQEVGELARVTVYETPTVGAYYDGKEFIIWKELSFDSATQVKKPDRNQARNNLHGFTYTLRLFFSAPLDQILGWTIDYGDIKAKFKPVFDEIDHQSLLEKRGLHDGDILSIAKWIREKALPLMPNLTRLELYERKNCGVILEW